MTNETRGTRGDYRELFAFYRRFAKEENGSMTIFACFMVFMMMMVAGIGVDMMVHEMERTRAQEIADRAVLAAADLDQTQDAETVVRDYFDKAGMSEYLISVDPDIGANYRSVTVTSGVTLSTQFIDFLGVDRMYAGAASTAQESVPKVEISLALDITTSMDNGSRIQDLKPAAKAFIDTVLADDAVAMTSVNLIPYGGQVNPGPVMFDHIGGVRTPPMLLNEAEGGIANDESLHGGFPVGYVHPAEDDDKGVGEDPDDTTRYVWPNEGSCPEIHGDIDTATNIFSASTALPTNYPYVQTPTFSRWNHTDTDTKDVGWCPDDHSSIQYMSNNRTEINDTIDALQLYDGTGTQYAMDWAIALLNPDSAPTLNALGEDLGIPAVFADRPAGYDDTSTLKYIILMTDGGISNQYRPNEIYGDNNAIVKLPSSKRYKPLAKNIGFTRFEQLCDLAKDTAPRPIIIYTIAFETRNATEENAMKYCASSPSHFFKSDGGSIAATFQTIARQINQLRLTQ